MSQERKTILILEAQIEELQKAQTSLLEWLKKQAHLAPTYAERCAYYRVIDQLNS